MLIGEASAFRYGRMADSILPQTVLSDVQVVNYTI